MRKYLDIINGVTEADISATQPLMESAEETVTEAAAEPARKSLQSYLDEVVALQESFAAAKISNLDVHEFINGYVACMLWSSTDESTPSGGEPLDKNYSEDDLSPEARDQIEADCRAFLHKAGPFISEERFKGASHLGSLESRAGHDFWLTRVGHGSGFWDGDWEGEDGMEGPLTKAAKAFGELHPYVGDDGKIHLM